jgi:hypothetical protein
MGKLLIATAMLMLVAGEKGSGGPVPPPIKPLPLPPRQCGDAFRDSDMAAKIPNVNLVPLVICPKQNEIKIKIPRR